MRTGNTSKIALRAALLAGASAVALSLSIGAANAQNVQLNGVAGSDFVTIDPAGNLGGFINGGLTTGTATGLSFNNGATATFNGPNFTTSINGDGLNTSGFVTVTAGAAFQQLNGVSLNSVDGAGNSSFLSPSSLIISDGTNNSSLTSTTLTVNTGTFGAAGNTTIDNGGNLTVGNAANPADLTVSGQTTTNGINNTGALNQNGVATFTNGANQGTSTISGGIVTIVGAGNIGGNISTLPGNAALTVSGGEIVSNGLIVHGGSELDGGATINGGAAINGGATIHGGAQVFGGATINGGATVNNGFTANGGVHLNGGTTISNSLSVTPGSNIDMGGNVVHDVATPILGTDAANKAYVDKGVNKAYEGTALALAISQPVFLPGQTFAIRGGWGEYESRNAFGVSAAGVIAHNVFGNGSTVSLDGGVGVGTSYNGVAGKAGITIGFGGGAYPLK
jgi:trimeric autotransporter adhesin